MCLRLPKDFSGKSAGAEIEIHPSGKFVYASNRFSDTIAVLSADSKGLLKLVENVPTQGKTPRASSKIPTGHWLILGNQDSDTMVIFKVIRAAASLRRRVRRSRSARRLVHICADGEIGA